MKAWYPEDENELQVKIVALAREQGWHADRLDRNPTNGIPDLTLAHKKAGDVWIEAKCPQHIFSVHDKLKLQHPLSARQREWLEERWGRGIRAGVIVTFRTGWKETPIDYVAWVPVQYWYTQMGENLMTWVLRPRTTQLSSLLGGSASLLSLIRGEVGPR